jgi:phage N-6-adenine-methyltransferase
MVAATAQPLPSRIPLAAIRVDGGTQVRVRIDGDAVNDYARVLADLPPVTVIFDGVCYWLADGFHRVAAHRQVGSLEVDAIVLEGTKRDAVILACGANADHGVRRTNRDKRNAVKTLLVDDEWSTWSDRQIAEACGVTHPFVSQFRRALEGGAEGGNGYHPGDDEDRDESPADDDEGDGMAKTKTSAVAALTSSESNEWYTPGEFLEGAREVMGGIDLDPASSPAANDVVKAARIFTAEDDGLAHEWAGRVWLNPPYGRSEVDGKERSNQATWTERLIDEHAAGRVEQACAMVTSKTADLWFQPLWDYPICFITGRVDFRAGEGQKESNNTQSQVVVYLGERVEAFERVFARFGRIVVPTPFGSASLRSQHLRLCGKCGKPCSTGRWCPTCKQYERDDRRWIRAVVDIAERDLRAGKEPSPTKIAVRVRAPWPDVARVLVQKGLGDDRMRAEWQRQAALARKGE